MQTLLTVATPAYYGAMFTLEFATFDPCLPLVLVLPILMRPRKSFVPFLLRAQCHNALSWLTIA